MKDMFVLSPAGAVVCRGLNIDATEILYRLTDLSEEEPTWKKYLAGFRVCSVTWIKLVFTGFHWLPKVEVKVTLERCILILVGSQIEVKVTLREICLFWLQQAVVCRWVWRTRPFIYLGVLVGSIAASVYYVPGTPSTISRPHPMRSSQRPRAGECHCLCILLGGAARNTDRYEYMNIYIWIYIYSI